MGLYPNIGGFGNESFMGLKDPELMLLCVQAYNDWLLDWISPDPRRFIPIMAVPFWDVEATVKEIHRGAQRGHKGILFTGAPQDFGFPFLGDPHWKPLWKAAQEVDLPVSLHLGGGDISGDFPAEKFRAHGMGPTISSQTVGLFLNAATQMVDVLTSGILPRNPALQIVSVESGIGWIPFVLESVDYTFAYAGATRDRPEYKSPPSHYFRRQVYGCLFHEEFAPKHLLDEIGADRILFETDYPHPVCLFGNVREKIDAGLGAQPEPVRHQVLWKNAADLYRVSEPDRPWRK
jgi:predicted TIM-barrel fold metal-dependent hydrolase